MMNPYFRSYLLEVTQSIDCRQVELIQSLWSGYGHIYRYQLDNSPGYDTVVVKNIALQTENHHPRGWNTSFGHQRKVRSYKVENQWYKKWSVLCTVNCKIPKHIGSFIKEDDQWIILEDLNSEFPIRKQSLKLSEVKVCLRWLASFHALFLNKKPEGLWEIGSYWHLRTRPEEFDRLEDGELKSKASSIDAILNNCKYQTIIHGDAKVANFCFSEDGKNVAAVDFQYVGGGCGIKDVAYFLGSCLSGNQCEMHEEELLAYYFSVLQAALADILKEVHFKELEQEWRAMYPIASTDFVRFLLGWMPSHQKINRYTMNLMNSVLLHI